MKIANLIEHVLLFGINEIENYPTIWEPFNTISGLRTLDKIIEALETENIDVAGYCVHEVELSAREWIELLEPYHKKCASIDNLIEYLNECCE